MNSHFITRQYENYAWFLNNGGLSYVTDRMCSERHKNTIHTERFLLALISDNAHSVIQAVLEAATICLRPLQVDLGPFDLESGARVTCDVGYLYANFSLPRPLCSRLRPDVRDRRETDVRRASSLNVPAMGAGYNKMQIDVVQQ